MTPITSLRLSPRRAALAALAALLALAVLSLLPATAAAQDSTKEEVRYTGAHDIRVAPVNYNLGVGSAQFAVFVTDPATGAPVPDAKVVMLAESAEEGIPAGPSPPTRPRRPSGTSCISNWTPPESGTSKWTFLLL